MPKSINHDVRRAEIAAAVLRVLARQGVRGVTMREVAIEAGWQTGVFHHYFADKQALLVGGLRQAARQTGVNMTRAMKTRDPRERLQAVIEEGMPLDCDRAAFCRIFLFFWAEGVSDPKLSEELARYYDWWRNQIGSVLQVGQTEGWIRPRVDVHILTESLVALADGIGVQANFSARSMSKHRMRQHVREWVRYLAPVDGAAPATERRGGRIAR